MTVRQFARDGWFGGIMMLGVFSAGGRCWRVDREVTDGNDGVG